MSPVPDRNCEHCWGQPKLQLHVDTGLAEAAHRALNREEPRRFDPLLCTDFTGAYVGMVRMERVVEQLAVLARSES
jgi:hypothetical protein